ncbi:uncharacterized protein LOC122267144 isoform X2 [Penaeus japonicus]|nr:uncharacterized protein LOC122267144 isoform X2 [Penaeus japonicus]XP_042893077.1 uncharacterized protein LOC122267144 isoform X2 [Penaeus japonicus]XP_042893078.1 uncharacterized protein LOC122267144 isoform X2 [Penaeus japonicus]XP_042893079.1 uncharacterized protein LOC122267144 isoform X2 [Penaeus japonicus]
MGDSHNIEYFPLRPENFDEVAKIMEDEYFPREPVCMGFHVTASATSGMTCRKLKECLASGVSFGARDVTTGTLTGVRLSFIKTKAEAIVAKPMDERKSEYEIKVCGLCEEIRSEVNIFQDSDAEKILYMFVLCVRGNYSGRGIAKKLVQMSIEQGKALGCQLVLATISNMFSSRIYTGLGFETRHSVDVSTLAGDWGLDLSAMKGNTMIHIMTKSL